MIYRNSDAIAAGLTPCETEPERGALSRTTEPFHALAVLTVGSRKNELRHVCIECAHAFHRHQRQRAGILWD